MTDEKGEAPCRWCIGASCNRCAYALWKFTKKGKSTLGGMK